MKAIYVTEFKNQFEVWQLLHATRSREKAFLDAGQSGRVIECVEKSALEQAYTVIAEMEEALKAIEKTLPYTEVEKTIQHLAWSTLVRLAEYRKDGGA